MVNENTDESLEQAIERFETVWGHGLRPNMGQYLPVPGHPDRRAWAIEFALVDLEFRLRQSDEAPLIEWYIQRFPEELGDSDTKLTLIEAEYKGRWRREPGITR